MAGDVEKIDEIRGELDDDGHKTFETSKIEPIKTQKRYGFNLGGPIIEDKLFFFVNYANWSSEMDFSYGLEGSGADNKFNITQDEYDEFNRILGDVYGRTDSIGGAPEDTNETLLAKISWNINDNHRLDFTYQWQDDQADRGASSGGNTLNLVSNRYVFATKVNNFAAKIYSDWNDDFSTEIGVSYKDVVANSNTNSDIGQVTVHTTGSRDPSFVFGRDADRHANVAENSNLTLSLSGTYLLEEHELNFGIQYEDLNLYNLYGKNSLGSWEFDTLSDFENGDLGRYNFSYANAYTNDVNDLAFDVTRTQLSLYLEDAYYLTDDILLTAGLRYERLSSGDKPTLNTAFEEEYGYTNQENLDGLDIILPRINIEWTAADNLTLSAGVGRFQGGIPNVWYTNPYKDDGMTLVGASNNVINDYYDNNKVDPSLGVPQEIQDSLEKGAGNVIYTDPNFKLPSSWRARIAADYNFDIAGLGNGFNWSTELMYHVKENEAVWTNTAMINPTTAADGERLIYENRYPDGSSKEYDIQMTNAKDDARSIIFSTALAKRWDNGLSMTMSYAHQDIEEFHSGSSSNTYALYKHNVVKNRNVDFAARGSYEVEHSLKINLGYEAQLFEGYNTNINLFFERRSGRPFSWAMDTYKMGDLGDTQEFNDSSAYLPYIPTGADDPNVAWDESNMSWEELEVFLNQAGISERGEILDRNTGTQPWVTTMDLSIKQEIPGFAQGHKGEIFLMIDNFANLLNDDWGVEKKIRYTSQDIYDLGGLTDDGRYKINKIYNGADTRNYTETNLGSSGWQMKIGINYRF